MRRQVDFHSCAAINLSVDDENDYAAAESKSNQWSWNYTIAALYEAWNV